MIAAGTRLGPYEILAPIGAGGMGEVYKARDTRLERSVAIKVLPAGFSENAQFKLRFEREAKTISQLNHPHICTLYDVGEAQLSGAPAPSPANAAEAAAPHRVSYLVMELLEGETLADRVARGPLPVAEVLKYGVQIAEALEKAHKAGVVHRDLKPGNVMITKAGAKLLDFGLAKDAAALFDADGPTRHKSLTAEGTIVGTLNYMAPEQLEGGAVDARTDIFALGTVLYEMATGHRAFEGKSKASLIASILTAEPQPISAVQPMTPAPLDRVVRTCLAKDPDERWQSAHDVATELKWMTDVPPAVILPRRGKREGIAWLLVVLLAAIVAAALVRQWKRPAAAARTIRFLVDPPANAAFNFSGRDAGPVAVSPDGTRLAFVATTTDGVKRLYVRSLDSVSEQGLSGSEGASYPFWSADGDNLGFFADGKLKRVASSGGAVTTLCDAPAGRGGTWNREGTILFTPSPYDPLCRIPASGGQPSPLTALDPSARQLSHRWPHFLPDGHHFLYLHFGNAVARGALQTIYLASLENPRGIPLMRANSQVGYVDPGYLLYILDGNLMALPFDAKSLRAVGDSFPVAENVQTYLNTANGVFSASPNGVVAYQRAGSAPISHLTWYDRRGKALAAVGAPDDYEDPVLSPDGRRVAVTRRDPDTGISNIWIYELPSGSASRFSYMPTFDHYPTWSPDGKRVVFDSNRNGRADIYEKSAGGDENLLYHSPLTDQPTDWTPDGTRVVLQTLNPATKWDLMTLTLADHHLTPLLSTPANEKDGQVSPDGKWLTYTSDEAGRAQVFVTRFPSASGRWQISSSGGGGSQPRWRGDGREIFFLSNDRRMMGAELQANGDDLQVLPPQALFPTRARYTGERSFDVSADGQKFLINSMVLDQPSSPLVVVVNWQQQVRPR